MAGDSAPQGDSEGWRQRGGEAYKNKDWQSAVRCYTEAINLCAPESELSSICLNNRAACHAQLKEHAAVVEDATQVIKRQPANVKALLRRMVAFDSQGNLEEALKDASSVLTMEPKNPHALQVVAKKRASLTKKANEDVPKFPATETLCVFLFSEDSPLQCYACLRSLRRYLKGARLHTHVFWQASDAAVIHSYQLLQALPETTASRQGKLSWVETSKGQLFPAFSRTINKLSVEGQQHLLLLSDRALFHTEVNVSTALKTLAERREAFTVRLDINPRVSYFPEASLLQVPPHLQHFSGAPEILLWTRSYDKSKQAFEAVARESGWDAILDWTATIIRVSDVQHFFSALVPPLDTAEQLDSKAADWLSRRQRMKRSEVHHRSACYETPLLVSLAKDSFGDARSADGLLRAHLFEAYGLSQGDARVSALAERMGWTPKELSEYFSKRGNVDDMAAAVLRGLLEPEMYKQQYWTSVCVPVAARAVELPKAINPPSPLVSWLVLARNAEHFVRGCLESIEGQSGMGAGTWELVIVEDGSKDGTLSTLRKLVSNNPCARLIENDERLGGARSLSEAWQHCRGDFVARIDAEHEAEPDRLSKQLRYLEQYRSISVVGCRARSFWAEERKCTLEKVTERPNGSVSAVAWREFHGTQQTRQREQLVLTERGGRVFVTEGPVEYQGCRVVQVGEESLELAPERWRAALREAQDGRGEVLLERRDPLEPPSGVTIVDPVLLRMGLLVNECIGSSTVLLRRSSFEACPFPEDGAAESHRAWLNLGPHLHVTNLADALVRTRRAQGLVEEGEESTIYESRCAAIHEHLKMTYNIDADASDAAALLHLRGPRDREQGTKLLEMLHDVSNGLIAKYIRPQSDEFRGEFWKEFVEGKEDAIERGLLTWRNRYKAIVDELARVETGADSPRHHRSRTPPR